jgi:protease I
MTDQPLAGKSIAILVSSGFEELEMTEPQRALLKLGATLKIVSPDPGLVNGWHGQSWGHYFPIDVSIGSMLAADYDMLLIPGGGRHVSKLKDNPHTKRIVGSFVDGQKPVALIDDGVLLLGAKAKGRALTSSEAVRAELEGAGARWSEEPVVVDDTLVTAQGHDALDSFVAAVVRVFTEYAELKRAA